LLDNFGFLNPPDQWDKSFAEGLGKQLGIYEGLTEQHWSFIHYLRKKFIDDHTVPLVVYACSENNMRLSELRRLFPTGYHRGACKIAGINYDFILNVNHWHTYERAPQLRSKYNMTSTGFLKNFEEWTEDFAHFVISELKTPGGLTDRHKQIIYYLRNYYKKNNVVPTLFETYDSNDFNFKEIIKLFPEGYRRGACRMAGLPFSALYK